MILATAPLLPVIEFETISEALRNTPLPSSDLVIGIGSGGVVLAAMAAYKLGVPMEVLWLNYRGKDNVPLYTTPKQSYPFDLPPKVNRILLVDDVAVSGKTLAVAKEQLAIPDLTTLVLKGNADIVLFPEIKSCVQWPWNPIHPTNQP